MYDKHEPSKEFIDRLEWEIGGEVRRRNRHARVPPWVPQSERTAVLALTGIVLVSMAFGAAGIAAAYQVQTGQWRGDLISGLEQRAEVARQRLKLSIDAQNNTERRLSLGHGNREDVLEVRAKAAEAEAQVQSLESQIEEVRVAGREPSNEISAPIVKGRDFVSERLQIEMAVPQAVLEFEGLRLRELERSVSLGAVSPLELEEAKSRVAEADAGVQAFRKKLEIRQQFLARKIDAATAELRILEAEAELNERALAPKIELARKESQSTAAKVRIGAASTMDQAEAAMRLEELEMERAKANLDLARVRQQLDQRRKGR
jgi:DNA-binding XRE family transcriptional regulator